jgi:fibronectin type 3 domain-containing protein
LNAFTALEELDSPSPGIPQLSITKIPGTHPVLSWTSVQNASQYKIYRAASFNDRYNYSVEGTTASTSWTDYDYNAVHPMYASSTFYYRVTAVYSSGEESITSNEVTCGANVAWKQTAENINHELKYNLYSNYPNPFNPSTIIAFSIQEKTFVKLHVYDILGREVSILVDDIKEAGTYSIDFDASALPSGVYIYSIHAGSFTSSKKMILTK